MELIGFLLEIIFFQIVEEMLLLMVLYGLLSDREQHTVLLIQEMGSIGRVLEKVFLVMKEEVLLGMEVDGLLSVKEQTI